MKQFDLQKYITNPYRKIVTRDGRPARIICTEAKGNYPVVALILNEGGEVPESYNEKGTYLNSNKSDNDLFFAPTKREGFVNVYYYNKKYVTEETIHDTKEEAMRFKLNNMQYITTVRIEWEE